MAESKNNKEATIYHVTPKGLGWQVKGVGNSRPTKIVKTQKEAIELANEIAKKRGGSVLIHKTTGRVRDSISYKDKK
ncbi:DUF2188 domain-containing protein [Mycoplasmopsis caviae]|uniref:DUF2188 domain-containing protein n=1 Tax=Mycoplasmopsis caviae TaxID=55603 RepID=A0A3P8K9Z3_9BACT|nr:DUF2188 domain-containing protein [Mycoplasmopsis caviae]UUD34977.1 DUF2188 domain-containing protein [Mycoplasmopsis caviae]VDR42199.1 Uncharacterised protein [Mycoplasmopsis caviae]